MEMKQLTIIIEYPASVGAAEIKAYAQEALEYWGGQRHPDDHLFGTVKAPKKHMWVHSNA